MSLHLFPRLEGDPNNYLTLFKRGTVYLAMGKTRFAIQDFTRVLELKPDFTAARLQRGTVHMKNGEYQEAAADLEQVVSLTNWRSPINTLYISSSGVNYSRLPYPQMNSPLICFLFLSAI